MCSNLAIRKGLNCYLGLLSISLKLMLFTRYAITLKTLLSFFERNLEEPLQDTPIINGTLLQAGFKTQENGHFCCKLTSCRNLSTLTMNVWYTVFQATDLHSGEQTPILGLLITAMSPTTMVIFQRPITVKVPINMFPIANKVSKHLVEPLQVNILKLSSMKFTRYTFDRGSNWYHTPNS